MADEGCLMSARITGHSLTKLLPKSLTDEVKPVRIVHPWGHGEWHHPYDRPMLVDICTTMNSTHGAGSHRVERNE